MEFYEYSAHDATGLAELVRNREVDAKELLDVAWQAIDQLNPQINAVTADMRELAHRQIAAGLPEGPFTGVPFVLKDEYLFYNEFPCDFASRIGAGTKTDYNSTLIERYLKAGLVITGKTNLPEFGASVTTEPVVKGKACNPWDLSRTTGGSSGGSAAAVAAGLVPMAYGNDGAGSIRIPASCCGCFGLKPTRARTPTGPADNEYWNGLVIQHAITRTVRDSAALLDASEGWEAGSLYPAPPKPRDYVTELDRRDSKLRIGMTKAAPTGGHVDLVCIEAVEQVAKLLESMGHIVEEASPDFDANLMAESIVDLLAIHLAYGIDLMSKEHGRAPTPDMIEAAHFELARRGRKMAAPTMLGILETFGATARRAAGFFNTYDLWLTPTLAEPPVEHGRITSNDADVDRYVDRYFGFVPFTPLANVTGCPAMTVPLHHSSTGLPVGVHFMSAFGDEGCLFRLAASLEEAAPWAGRHPSHSIWNL